MSRCRAAVTIVVAITAATLAAPATATIPRAGSGPGAEVAEVRAERALGRAVDALGTGSTSRSPSSTTSPTLALREVWRLRGVLQGRERARADGLLARPTDDSDQFGDGYTTGAVDRRCSAEVCVHRVTRPANPDHATEAFADRALAVLADVHDHHVDRLGWRRPVPDGRRGGDARFDVYLADVGAAGVYGYCAPDDNTGLRHRVAAYCVLDNDFARAQFPRSSPDESLRVTAAHEYLHALQYAYDALEDGWLLESTATWMEEVYAGDVDDNRQYLPGGQLRRPRVPLDAFEPGARGPYGNWIFFEHLAHRHGRSVVRSVWEQAAPRRVGSVAAVARALGRRGGALRAAYAAFVADNTVPGRSPAYAEGGEWGLRAPVTAYRSVSPRSRTPAPVSLTLDHLTSVTVSVRSSGFAAGNRLRIAIAGPDGRTAPAAYVVVHRKDGSLARRYVPLDGAGRRTMATDISSGRVARVTVTVVNASPTADGSRFTLDLSAVR